MADHSPNSRSASTTASSNGTFFINGFVTPVCPVCMQGTSNDFRCGTGANCRMCSCNSNSDAGFAHGFVDVSGPVDNFLCSARGCLVSVLGKG